MTLGTLRGHPAIVLRHPGRATTILHSQKYLYITTYFYSSVYDDLFTEVSS